MLRVFGPDCTPAPIDADRGVVPSSAVWIDLFEPTHAEEQLTEKLLGTNIPTRDETLETKATSR